MFTISCTYFSLNLFTMYFYYLIIIKMSTIYNGGLLAIVLYIGRIHVNNLYKLINKITFTWKLFIKLILDSLSLIGNAQKPKPFYLP